MKILPFTISLSVLFWGWQTDMLAVAVCIVPILEGTYFVRSKWDFDDQDLNKISDFCTLILAGILVYYIINDPRNIIARTVIYLPIIVLPIMGAQRYSTAGNISINSLMLFSGKTREVVRRPYKKIDFSYVYIVICIIAAGMGNKRNDLYYISIVCFSFLILFPLRSKRYSLVIWMSLFTIAVFSGFFIHNKINRLQEIITEYTIQYLASYSTNPRHQVTSIGEIGTLKLSNTIISRVQKEDKSPVYLRLASYTSYKKGSWFATLSGFNKVKSDKDKTKWILNNGTAKKKNQLTLYTTIGESKILEVPKGTLVINNLKVRQLEKNTLGTVKATNGEGFTACTISFNEHKSNLRAPQHSDTIIPENFRQILEDYILSLNAQYQMDLRTLTNHEKLRLIKSHFAEKYLYSLTQKEKDTSINPVVHFLLDTNAGHCEYFATATVLLLRALNIPTRYATGYLVHEFNTDANLFILRQRDAHAWCLVYLDGEWINFDTTPSNWLNYDKEKTDETPLRDLISNCRFIVSKWLSEHTKQELLYWAAVVTLPLTLFLLFRMRPSQRARRVKPVKNEKKIVPPVVKSGLYLIEEKLNKKGYLRYNWETYGDWFERINANDGIFLNVKEIEDSLLFHYRHNYGYHRFNQNEIEAIETTINTILKKVE